MFEDVKWPNSEGYKVGRRWLRLFELLRNPLIDLFTDRDGFLIGNRDISRTSVGIVTEKGVLNRGSSKPGNALRAASGSNWVKAYQLPSY